MTPIPLKKFSVYMTTEMFNDLQNTYGSVSSIIRFVFENLNIKQVVPPTDNHQFKFDLPEAEKNNLLAKIVKQRRKLKNLGPIKNILTY